MFIGIGLSVSRPALAPAGPSLNLNFTSSIPAGVTVVSSPVGYAPKADGTWQSFTANVGRRTNLGLMVEPAATNLCLWSQAFDNAGYAPNMGTVTADSQNAPDGSATADVFNETGGSGVYFLQPQSSWPASPLMRSVFVKPLNRSWVAINANNGTNQDTYFNLSGVGAVGTTIGPGVTLAGITAYANGWYRIQMQVTGGGTELVIPGVGDGNNSLSGNGLPIFALWNYQVETGGKATTPILTTSASATRTADLIQFTVPAGITKLTYTFDDNSTQLITGVSAGTYTIPTNLNRAQIKTIVGS